MSGVWTTQRVLELAPDAASAKAGRGQAQTNKWSALGRSDSAVWGEVQGSGRNPYQARIDLREPAFKCSCPSRKFPCKHSLGLLLILAEQPDEFAPGDPPPWVNDWLASREQRAEQQRARAEEKAEMPVDVEAQAKRIARRETKVQAGMEELERYLGDAVRQGLASVQAQPPGYWDQMAARMIDAQAPGIARLVRQLGQTVGSGDQWQSRFMRQAARLHLAIEGYRRLERLPEPTQADLRALVGWTQTRDTLLERAAATGTWCVVGQVVEEEDRITTQRTWLARCNDSQPALLLHFAAGNQPLDTSLIVGTQIDADVVYFPGACPLRAIVKERRGEPAEISELNGAATLDEALAQYAAGLAMNPWIDRWPMAIAGVIPVPRPAGHAAMPRWFVRDREERELPLNQSFTEGWTLLSISGGRPVTLFGEWDGEELLPMGMWDASVYVTWSRGSNAAISARVA